MDSCTNHRAAVLAALREGPRDSRQLNAIAASPDAALPLLTYEAPARAADETGGPGEGRGETR